MQITVNKVGKPYKEGNYFKVDFEYNRDGKDTSRKLVAVGDGKEVFNTLKDSKTGEQYEIKLEKKGEFWNWVGAAKLEGGAATSQSTQPSRSVGVSDAQRQRLIVRQSCLSNAVAMAGTKSTIEGVFAMAERMVNWVFEKVESPVASLTSNDPLKDDLPEFLKD